MYTAADNRYEAMEYRRCGKSGIHLPLVSLGIWQNFGSASGKYEDQKKILLRAFDLGITHIDMANNYGPPYGSAEETFGRVFASDLKPYRDELLLSTKAGFDMWKGPYGNWGSKKYLIASIDQSLKRTGLEYFDIFYHHRPDGGTPIEETCEALEQIVRSGKALYVGISNYGAEEARKAIEELERRNVHCLIHQPNYHMRHRWIEGGLQDVLEEKGVGTIAFGPLAGGMLTDRYLKGVPAGSRRAREGWGDISKEDFERISKLNEIAASRNQTLAQMAIAWVLREGKVTSALVGASSVAQIEDSAGAIKNLNFTAEELAAIDEACR